MSWPFVEWTEMELSALSEGSKLQAKHESRQFMPLPAMVWKMRHEAGSEIQMPRAAA